MIQEISEERIEKILKGIAIPSPPQIMADLQLAMYDPDPDLNAIAQLISTDPGLTGGMLKAANSPAFGLKTKITSVPEAAIALGFNTIAMIVNTICLRAEILEGNIDKETRIFLNQFWDTCTDIATISTLVADRARVSKYRNNAYLLGLFHNVGIVLMRQRFDDYQKVLTESYGNIGEQRIVDIENQRYETNHTVIGYYTAKSWKTPNAVITATAKHHTLQELFNSNEEEEVKTLVAILKVAEHISGFYQSIGGQAQDYEWQRFGDEVMSYLGLTQDDYDDLASHAADQGLGSGDNMYY